MEEMKKVTEQMRLLVAEIETYSSQRTLLLQAVKKIDRLYVKKQLSYSQYKDMMQKALSGMTKREALQQYDAYIYSLLKQLDQLNARVFYYFYNNEHIGKKKKPVTHSVVNKKLAKAKKSKVAPQKDKPVKAQEAEKTVKELKPIEKKKVHDLPVTKKKKPAEPVNLEPERIVQTQVEEKKPEKKRQVAFPERKFSFLEFLKHPFTKISFLSKKKPGKAKPVSFKSLKPSSFVTEKGIKETKTFFEALKEPFTVLGSWITRKPRDYELKNEKLLVTKRVGKNKVEQFISFKSWHAVILRRFHHDWQTSRNPFAKSTTAAGSSLIKLSAAHAKTVSDQEYHSRINPYLLAQEAERIRNILQKQKELKAYQASTVGIIANQMTRKLSLWLIDEFPDFFRKLYNSLRSANVSILSNTYVNIMVLATSLATIFSFFFFGYFFWSQAYSFLSLSFNVFFLSFLVGVVTFAAFYVYPLSIIRTRKRAINTSLPFAVNHMSAVTGSGVPPTHMFRLVSDSDEYEEVSREIAKITRYVDVFGYDLLTAIKSVAAITPSPTLKEFFDGMTSTIETGGDLKLFLQQKADEIMLSYNLEREKYLETISTYSDIYTGILIAAPLFFVVALSLVNILGGTVGGIDVNTLVVLGTYVIIPLINILFLLFLEATQPEI